MLSIESLRTTMTRAEAVEFILEQLKKLGFQTTGWQNGRIQKSIITAMATMISDFSEVVKVVVEMNVNDLATGEALSILSKSRFGNTRKPALYTEGPMLLTSTATIPYPIEVGKLIITNKNGVQFRNTTGGTIVAGGTLQIQVKAILAGTNSNIASNSSLILVTPYAGVSITNPPALGNTWYTSAGVDQESDASLRRRNETKITQTSLEKTVEAYEGYALGLERVEKAKVDATNPRGPGTLDIYISAAASLLGDDDMRAAQEAFSTYAWFTDPTWPPPYVPGADNNSRVAVVRPIVFPLVLNGVIYHDPGVSREDLEQRVEQALDDFLAPMPMGGKDYSPGPENVITLGDVMGIMERVRGVKSLTLTNMYRSGDSPNGIGNLVVPNFGLVTRPPNGWFHASTGLVAVAVNS